MLIPPKILALVEQLNEELNFVEQVTSTNLSLTKTVLERFPDNVTLTQFFAYLNSMMLLVEIDRRRIQEIIEGLSALNEFAQDTENAVQEVGETLGTELGRVIEAKMVVSQIKSRLENL
jgi:hypothetical protein